MQNYVETLKTFDKDIKQLQTKLETLECEKKKFKYNNDASLRLYNSIKSTTKINYNNRICNSCGKIGVDVIVVVDGHSESHSHGRENYKYQDVEVQCCLPCYNNYKVKVDYHSGDYLYPVIIENHY